MAKTEGTNARRTSRAPALPKFKLQETYRGSRTGGGISVTANQVVNGLQKIACRFADWATPLNVASILLWRLDQYRKDSGERANIALWALERGDIQRAARELYAIRSLCQDGLGNDVHQVSVSHDLAAQRVAVSASAGSAQGESND